MLHFEDGRDAYIWQPLFIFVVRYFKEGGVVLQRGWCGTLKRVIWYFEEGGVVFRRGWCGTLKRVMWYFEEGDVVLWRRSFVFSLTATLYICGPPGTGKTATVHQVVCELRRGPLARQVKIRRYEEGGVVFRRGWCGTLKRGVWYFEEGDVVLWRGWCATLKRVMWYFEEGGVVLWRGCCAYLKRVVCYFEEGGVLIWRGLCATSKRVVC